ncbi:ribosomal-protein-alanine N-acetyltransferase [Psychrobacter sp. L7]|uniref:ribosomal protein S18-alanine N-acetyltransferase n=1 Tax=Psychrobacter sp. L7 TaxID=1982756 RepID=UPI000C2A527A|nr:ribosomal protein S18-alanine N-acetyltransferase [Psychrobacter sp. L7]PJX26762.1 ribosomal-protein-alanine N-acetyltransferase [Psychrobacter sp. L7]
MTVIQNLSKDTQNFREVVQAVAAIESIVQLQDAWSYQAMIDLFEQDSVHLLIAYESAESAESAAVVQGYCLYQSVFEQAEILRIGTHPDYQRRGIASQIFAQLHLVLRDKQVDSLLLEVRADNAPAIALYKQQGFEVIHQRKNYYQLAQKPAVDALIMQLTYRDFK